VTDGIPTRETELGRALLRRRDITRDYLAPGALLSLIEERAETREALRARLRELMAREGTLGTVAAMAAPAEGDADRLLRDGVVSAVDGTPALRSLELPTCTVYGAAIAVAGSRLAAEVKVEMTGTTVPTPAVVGAWDEGGLVRFAADLELAREATHAWTGTFREYLEREAALDRLAAGDRLVLIDGPIYTQNLLFHEEGRDLLSRLHAAAGGLIGYIKSLTSKPLLDAAGWALEPGEAWAMPYSAVVAWKAAQERRSDPDAKVARWLAGKSWVRVVYKIGLKHFCAECDESLVPLALAMVTGGRESGRLHHDIPFLLELADGAVRRSVHPDAVTDQLSNRLFGQDLAGLVSATGERNFR
jgi:hypothetical protein